MLCFMENPIKMDDDLLGPPRLKRFHLMPAGNCPDGTDGSEHVKFMQSVSKYHMEVS